MNSYYPFGLQFNSYSRVTSKQNDYLYNGKELQDELDLNWLDYGARMYDPTIGRWGVIDEYSEAYFNVSPFSYVLNNPIRFIDKEGNYVVLPSIKDGQISVKAYRIKISTAKFHDNLSSMPLIGLSGLAVKGLYASTDPSYNLSKSDYVFGGMSAVGLGQTRMLRNFSNTAAQISNAGFEVAGMAGLSVENDYTELFLDELAFKITVGVGLAKEGIGASDRMIQFKEDYVDEIVDFVQSNSKKELSGKRLLRAVQKEIETRLDSVKENLRALGEHFDLKSEEGQKDFRLVLNAIYGSDTKDNEDEETEK